jgi:hypothetical protein
MVQVEKQNEKEEVANEEHEINTRTRGKLSKSEVSRKSD